MDNSAPLVSFVIPTLNQPVRLIRCLEYIYRQDGASFEIMVVNNGPAELMAPVQARFADVRIFQIDTNRGFAVACNRGIVQARGDFIALVNDDALLHPHWLRNMLAVFAQHPDCTSCASDILYLDRVFIDPDSKQICYIVDCQGDGYLVSGFGYKRNWGSLFRPGGTKPVETFGANAAASIYRRAFFDDVGLLDEDLFCFVEDVDLSFRARLLGHRCLYVPNAYVFHAVRATALDNTDTTIFYSYRNFLIVWLKNMPSRLMFKYALHFLAHQCLVSLRFLWLPGCRAYYRALWAFLTDLPAIMRGRKLIQQKVKSRRSCSQFKLDTGWFALLKQYRVSRKKLKLAEVRAIPDHVLCMASPDPSALMSSKSMS